MTNTDAQELLLNILRQAEEGKSIEFRFITSWYDFKDTIKDYRATKLIVRTLQDSAKNLFKSYCKAVSNGTADFTQLLAYYQLQDIIAFYEKDLSTLRDMLNEYDNYLGQGNFWFSFLGGIRDI